ncbi:ATP-binding protein [Actinacidiphila soli]|uniref:ATP-binding protein n=1 Tax=Actinacidiphila soli TaxID=2487275 RepID=UPI0019D2BF3A|nr:ATP-binding protein [Actinacidiphila soli]
MDLATSHPSPQLLSEAAQGKVHWLKLPAGLASIGAARSATDACLRTWGLAEESCEDAVLVLSELATNAIRHTPSEQFLCCVGLTADNLIHLEVHDHDTAVRSLIPCSPSLDDEGGRGLFLVQHMAERWGVERSVFTGGNAVWARLAGTRSTGR